MGVGVGVCVARSSNRFNKDMNYMTVLKFFILTFHVLVLFASICYRNDVHGGKRADRRGRRGHILKVCAVDIDQNRDRYATRFLCNDFKWHYLTILEILISPNHLPPFSPIRPILLFFTAGQIDPEKIGSGIQFGDSSLRLMRKGRGGVKLRRKSSTSRFSNCC